MDVVSIPRVRHEGILIVPSDSQLIIQLGDDMEHALGYVQNLALIGQRAINSLPETPLAAAGVNYRYRWEQAPPHVVQLLEGTFGEVLADLEFEQTGKSVQHQFGWEGGHINVSMAYDYSSGEGNLQINFSRQTSEVSELVKWLGKTDTMHTTQHSILQAVTRGQ